MTTPPPQDTPRTEKAFLELLEQFSQYYHGKIYLTDMRGAFVAARFDMEALERDLALATRLLRDGWCIWSNEHRAWWRPEAKGYCQQIGDAGRYSFKDATDIVNGANYGHSRGKDPICEVMVPSPELQKIIASDHSSATPKPSSP